MSALAPWKEADGRRLRDERARGFWVSTQTILVKGLATLFLMYDIYKNPAGAAPGTATSFFDVFFQVRSEHNDYDARIFGDNSLKLYEKAFSKSDTTTTDGSLDVSKAPWTLLDPTDPDFARANPKGAIGFGTSIDNSTAHVLVEFQLDINNSLTGPDGKPRGGAPGDPNAGLYDPDPSFWSGSGKPGGTDPPFTSGIFSLNANGSSNVTPALGPQGGPVQQPEDVATPEPATLTLLAFGIAGMAGYGWRRRRAVKACSV
jgi:hypothetical protein